MRWLYRWQRHVALTALETTVLLGLVGLLMLGLAVQHWQIQQIPTLSDQLHPAGAVPDSLLDAGSYALPALTAAPDAPVNVNTASAEELQALSGIGPALSQRIVDYRRAHGPFPSVDALQNVSGIGPKTVAGLADRVVLSDSE